jgi:hypothetical protein
LDLLWVNLCNLLDNIINRDFGIDNLAADLEELHTESKWLNLVTRLPGKTILTNILMDILGKLIEVLVNLESLDLQDDSGLLSGKLGGILLVVLSKNLEFLLSFEILLSVLSKEIELVFLFFLTLFLLTDFLSSPEILGLLGKSRKVPPPGEQIWIGFSARGRCLSLKDFNVFLSWELLSRKIGIFGQEFLNLFETFFIGNAELIRHQFIKF